MSYISISDINGKNTINNNTDLLLIKTNRGNLFLQRIYCSSKKGSIWKMYMPNIKKLLLKYKLNANLFYPLGDIYFKDKNLPKDTYLLLVNDNYSNKPIDYKKISTDNNISLWKPINNKINNNTNIGLIASYSKPSLNRVRILDTENIKDIDKFNFLSQSLYNDQDSTNSWTTQKGKHIVLSSEKKQPWYREKKKLYIIEDDSKSSEEHKIDDINTVPPTNFKTIALLLMLFILILVVIGYYLNLL